MSEYDRIRQLLRQEEEVELTVRPGCGSRCQLVNNVRVNLSQMTKPMALTNVASGSPVSYLEISDFQKPLTVKQPVSIFFFFPSLPFSDESEQEKAKVCRRISGVSFHFI